MTIAPFLNIQFQFISYNKPYFSVKDFHSILDYACKDMSIQIQERFWCQAPKDTLASGAQPASQFISRVLLELSSGSAQATQVLPLQTG